MRPPAGVSRLTASTKSWVIVLSNDMGTALPFEGFKTWISPDIMPPQRVNKSLVI